MTVWKKNTLALIDFFQIASYFFCSGAGSDLNRLLKDWQAINFVQLKIRTSKPAKLNIDMSNGEEVSLQKYEIIRYE